jgi:hypothetical protein
MKTIRCGWNDHCVSPLIRHAKLDGLEKEPELEIISDLSRSPSAVNICRIRDETSLFVAWEHDDPLEITVFLQSGIRYLKHTIEKVKGGFLISGLSRHVNVRLACGKPFASIEWQWVRNGPVRTLPDVFDMPIFTGPEPVKVTPLGSEPRLRAIFRECFATEAGQPDWFDRMPHAANGAVRALILKKLGAGIAITPELLEHLSKGRFRDHFGTHWVQMASLHPYLRHDDDWRWAADRLVPPERAEVGLRQQGI